MGMNPVRALKMAGTLFGVSILLVAFQNCGGVMGDVLEKSKEISGPKSPDGDEDTDGESSEESTGDLCEDQLLAKFGSGYHVFLKNNCAVCHDGNHEAPAFASKNTLTSYQVFKDKGYKSVSDNAISAAHNPPATGSHHNGTIGSLRQEWEQAQEAWLQCKGTDTVDKSVITANKSLSIIVSNKATASYWGTLSWNLNSDMPAGSAKFPLSLSVDAQVAKVSGNEVGYAVRNPTMSVTSGTTKYRVKALFFSLNNQLQDSATVYRNINAVVCPGAPLNLEPVGNAQLLVLSPVASSDTLALQLSSIEIAAASDACGTLSSDTPPEDTTPATVSFAQLTATTGTLNVFKTQCFSCHVGAGAAGGLDLSNYNSSKAAANKILNRINDSGSPMPTSGLMSSSMRAIVEKWVTTGTPQN